MPEDEQTRAESLVSKSTEAAVSNTLCSKEDSQQKATEDTMAEPEVDEFGLPIRKPKRHLVEHENHHSDEECPVDAKGIPQQNSAADVSQNSPVTKETLEPSLQEISNRPPQPEEARAIPSHSPVRTRNSEPKPEKPPITHNHGASQNRSSLLSEQTEGHRVASASEWSHQQLAPQPHAEDAEEESDGEWQDMPAYAPFDIYDDDNKLIAREVLESDDEAAVYGGLGGAGKGYTRVQVDEDAESATSMDDNTAYLFKERGTNVVDEDDDARDPLAQLETTKMLLTEGQRIAYVGIVRLAMVQMTKEADSLERSKGTKKELDIAVEAMKMWSQKMMVRLYSHMDISPEEQIMIEQLAEHGLEPNDLTPALMQNARVDNPVADTDSSQLSMSSPRLEYAGDSTRFSQALTVAEADDDTPPPPYEFQGDDLPAVRTPAQLPKTKKLDIDLRWTVLCDLFLVLIADSIYDSRSRELLQLVGSYLDVSWLDICRFEKKVTDALEMQEAANKENWNEEDHMANRKKMARNRRLVMMGLATVGGGLVIGLSAGLLAPVIGAGLAAGFTTIGVAGTGGFLAGAGGAAIITTTGVVTGGTIAIRASSRRTGAVKTFEYRPLHNNKKVNLIITVSGWMNGKVDDVRLPFSTVDPMMGDIYSVFWEPEMLQSMGDTINILATEALTQGLQQILGSTILIALMSALQLPIVLTKLSYLIDNPWTVSLARAELAGLILADSLVDRNLGLRPVTLVGFSLGSRVIFSCLKELARKGAYGLVQNVYIFGSPVVVRNDEYIRAKSIVSGRFVNGYATNDWILGYLFRATSGGVMRVAGLAPVTIPGIENINVTDLVAGHMAYRAAMPKLLRHCGWLVESDEFTEIEDPDPDNHDKRQRELINEIEEARKQLEKKPEKKRFGLFRKKLAEKKEWEMYDDNIKNPKDGLPDDKDNVLFDIDAIRTEVAQLAAEGIQVTELESTLPPMKLNTNTPASIHSYSNLRETESYDGMLLSSQRLAENPSSSSLASSNSKPQSKDYGKDECEDYQHSSTGDDGISMTFDTSYNPSPLQSYTASPTVPSPSFSSTLQQRSWNDSPGIPSSSFSPNPPQRSWSNSPAFLSTAWSPAPPKGAWETSLPERPSLQSSVAIPAPGTNLNPTYNAWVDDEDDGFGKEKEMKMTFE